MCNGRIAFLFSFVQRSNSTVCKGWRAAFCVFPWSKGECEVMFPSAFLYLVGKNTLVWDLLVEFFSFFYCFHLFSSKRDHIFLFCFVGREWHLISGFGFASVSFILFYFCLTISYTIILLFYLCQNHFFFFLSHLLSQKGKGGDMYYLFSFLCFCFFAVSIWVLVFCFFSSLYRCPKETFFC